MTNDQYGVFYPKFIPNEIWDILPERVGSICGAVF
jgi:hypothetical protein